MELSCQAKTPTVPGKQTFTQTPKGISCKHSEWFLEPAQIHPDGDPCTGRPSRPGRGGVRTCLPGAAAGQQGEMTPAGGQQGRKQNKNQGLDFRPFQYLKKVCSPAHLWPVAQMEITKGSGLENLLCALFSPHTLVSMLKDCNKAGSQLTSLFLNDLRQSVPAISCPVGSLPLHHNTHIWC